MSDLLIQMNGYRLTTAQILYHLPDYPLFLQTYVWQDYDLAPEYPTLLRFLDFWKRELDGRLHSVFVASRAVITPNDPRFFDTELTLQ